MLVYSDMQTQSFLSPFDWPLTGPSNQLLGNFVAAELVDNLQIVIVTSSLSTPTIASALIYGKDQPYCYLGHKIPFFVIGIVNDLSWKRLVT